MLDGFKERKEKALRLYDEYKLLREKYDDNISGETLETKRKKIEDDRFLLLVAGEAKSGKSTFINAFLGVDILPMDVKQCTSALIEINYGTDIALTVSYADDRTETISGEEKVREFLKNHAALSDDYRKIPVTTINNEIIIKSQGTVKESEINDLINGVKTDNVYHLSDDEYSRLIREYINEWKDKWQDIVTRINVSYPFTETMRDITVIDSPGVNAAGMVGDITNGFIEKADAIVFVKSLNGQAAESLSFRKFLDSNIMGRSKASLLMALTGKTHKEKHEVHDLEDQLAEMYQESLSKDHLTSVDSKLQLYFHFCKDKKAEEIGGFIKESEFKDAKALWGEAEKDKKEFLRLLEKEANFGAISEMLEKFGVKAHDNRLLEFLNMISGGYETIQKKLEENADLLRKSAEDPGKLKKEIEKKKEEIEEVKLKMHKGVREIEDVYTNNENGIIKSKAEEAFENFKKELSGVSGFDAVEKKPSKVRTLFSIFKKNYRES